jgi:putative acetyltransferase
MNITIRRIESSDFEAMYKVFTGSKVISGTLQLPFPSIDVWRKRIAEPQDGQYRLAAMVGEELAGQLDIHTFPNHPRRKHAGQIGMAVRDDFQGQGVGTALLQAATDMADNWLNILRLELEVFVDNEPAIKLYKKCGFEIEGTLKRYAFRAGQYVDVYTMARFKAERTPGK